jgi:hypothetical protein
MFMLEEREFIGQEIFWDEHFSIPNQHTTQNSRKSMNDNRRISSHLAGLLERVLNLSDARPERFKCIYLNRNIHSERGQI